MAAKSWNQNVKNMTTVARTSRDLGAEDLIQKFLILDLTARAPTS